jgi:hypothetical protein
MAEDMIRIRIGMSVNYIAGSDRENVEEIPRAEWAAKTPEEREAYLNDAAETEIANSVEAWAYVEDEG